jgi:YVTN family beta-propeller protein
VLKKIPIGTGGAAGIVMDPSGGKAYVSCSADNKVAVIDLASLSVTGNIQTDEAPDGIAWANLDGTGGGVSP